jgi:hypothetical protein
MSDPHITTQERKDAYTRAKLWRIGMSFHQAQAAPLVRWALEKSALARRKRHAIPAQPSLI